MEQLEFAAWFMVGLLAGFVVLISFLYWLEAKRDLEEINQQKRYNKFLATGNDYHFLDKGGKE